MSDLISRLKEAGKWRDAEACFTAADEIIRLRAELAECRRQSVSLYNSGYHAGHHDTVEGCYTHILPCDMSTYHDDVVAALREGGE